MKFHKAQLQPGGDSAPTLYLGLKSCADLRSKGAPTAPSTRMNNDLSRWETCKTYQSSQMGQENNGHNKTISNFGSIEIEKKDKQSVMEAPYERLFNYPTQSAKDGEDGSMFAPLRWAGHVTDYGRRLI